MYVCFHSTLLSERWNEQTTRQDCVHVRKNEREGEHAWVNVFFLACVCVRYYEHSLFVFMNGDHSVRIGLCVLCRVHNFAKQSLERVMCKQCCLNHRTLCASHTADVGQPTSDTVVSRRGIRTRKTGSRTSRALSSASLQTGDTIVHNGEPMGVIELSAANAPPNRIEYICVHMQTNPYTH